MNTMRRKKLRRYLKYNERLGQDVKVQAEDLVARHRHLPDKLLAGIWIRCGQTEVHLVEIMEKGDDSDSLVHRPFEYGPRPGLPFVTYIYMGTYVAFKSAIQAKKRFPKWVAEGQVLWEEGSKLGTALKLYAGLAGGHVG